MYRYGISNCLFEATYEKVLEICQCTPYFHWAGMKKHRRFCRGPALVCMNQVFDRIGEYNEVIDESSNNNVDSNSSETGRKVQKVNKSNQNKSTKIVFIEINTKTIYISF